MQVGHSLEMNQPRVGNAGVSVTTDVDLNDFALVIPLDANGRSQFLQRRNRIDVHSPSRRLIDLCQDLLGGDGGPASPAGGASPPHPTIPIIITSKPSRRFMCSSCGWRIRTRLI